MAGRKPKSKGKFTKANRPGNKGVGRRFKQHFEASPQTPQQQSTMALAKAAAKAAVAGGVKVSQAERRTCIKVLWVAHGKPLPAEWNGPDGTVSSIVKTLTPHVFPPRAKASGDTVRRVLTDLAQADEAGKDCDVSLRRAGSGGHNKKMDIKFCRSDKGMAIGLHHLGRGFSQDQATARCNVQRKREGKTEISRHVLMRIFYELGGAGQARAKVPGHQQRAGNGVGESFLSLCEAGKAAV